MERYSQKSPGSPSVPKRKRNAFDVLNSAAKAKAEKQKRPLERSEFVEAEAQESDDDEMFGFGHKKADDGEEEDGEDLDKNLEALVDDRDMDEDVVAEELVREKHKYVCLLCSYFLLTPIFYSSGSIWSWMTRRCRRFMRTLFMESFARRGEIMVLGSTTATRILMTMRRAGGSGRACTRNKRLTGTISKH